MHLGLLLLCSVALASEVRILESFIQLAFFSTTLFAYLNPIHLFLNLLGLLFHLLRFPSPIVEGYFPPAFSRINMYTNLVYYFILLYSILGSSTCLIISQFHQLGLRILNLF